MRRYRCGARAVDVSRETQRGQAILEFILILPLLLLVVAAVWEYGRVFEAQLVATNAAREGARYASTNGTTTGFDPSEVATRVEDYALTGFGNRLVSIPSGQTTFNGVALNPNGDVTIDSISVCYYNDLVNPNDCLSTPGQQYRVVVTVQGTVRVFMPFLPGLQDPYHLEASTTMLVQ